MLELQNVSYQVDSDGTDKEIIKNVSLKIDQRFTAITGPNGGGKSTLAKLIAGIITEKGILRPDYNKSIAEAFRI